MQARRRSCSTRSPYVAHRHGRELLDAHAVRWNKAKDFSKKAFVDALTFAPLSIAKLHASSSSGSADFAARPFIEVFETAIAELVKMRKRVLCNVEELEDQQTASENSHKGKLANLNRSFQNMYLSFRTLESRIGDVGNTAVKIGEQLETIDKQRANAGDAQELISLFFDFNNQDTAKMETMRQRMGADGQYRAAVIARRLMQISRELDIPGTEQARLGIEKYCELLETDLLRTFQDAYEKNTVACMSECAKVLYEFNGGNSCMQAFVNQHAFFMLQFHVGEIDVHSLDRPDYGLLKMTQQLRATIYQDWELVSAVFSNAPQVIHSFLQRVFAQSVQPYVEAMLDKALAISTMTYLRVLTSSHRAVMQLVKDFAHFDEQVLLPHLVSTGVIAASAAVNATAVSSLTQRNGVPISLSISIAIQRCADDLFVPFVDGVRYLDKENRCLTESMDGVLIDFNTFQLNRKLAAKKPTGVFARLNAATISSTSTSVTSKPLSENDEGNKLSIDIVLHILKMHVEAIARCVELSDQSDLVKNMSTLFGTLLEHLSKRYIETALDTVAEDTVLDGKAEPEFKSLGVVQAANTIVHLIQTHFQTVILPIVASAPMFHRELVASKNAVLQRLETKINGLQLLNADLTHLSTATNLYLLGILSKQKKTDFKPKEDSIEVGLNTPPCMQVVECLKRLHSSFTTYFDGKNLEMALSEIGVTLHDALMDHFQKFSVSTAGSLVVSKDLAKYQETIAQFRITHLNDRFDLLREIGNLFLVRPENLLLILDEGRLARLDHAAVYPFLTQRMDFKSAHIDVLVRQREQKERYDSPTYQHQSVHDNGKETDSAPDESLRESSQGSFDKHEQHQGTDSPPRLSMSRRMSRRTSVSSRSPSARHSSSTRIGGHGAAQSSRRPTGGSINTSAGSVATSYDTLGSRAQISPTDTAKSSNKYPGIGGEKSETMNRTSSDGISNKDNKSPTGDSSQQRLPSRTTANVNQTMTSIMSKVSESVFNLRGSG